MKVFMVIVDDAAGTTINVMLKANTPVEMLKHIIISATSGESDLGNPKIEQLVFEVNQFWKDNDLYDLDINETIDRLCKMVDDDLDELLVALDILDYRVTENPQEFLQQLRKLLNGEIEHFSEVTEDQVLVLAMVEK